MVVASIVALDNDPAFVFVIWKMKCETRLFSTAHGGRAYVAGVAFAWAMACVVDFYLTSAQLEFCAIRAS